ncbi:MAG: DNA polymerase IV [Solirubrobacterales bacterium]|nr:DNA polymerase IV [Solirubrobacterales bacterium]
MGTAATILHADLDAFFASVEQRDDPTLRNRPMAVGTGVVLAASYEARARGVFTTMNSAQARRACPELTMVPPRMGAYSAASREVYSIFRETVPVVEALSIDEAFLETRGLGRIKGSPEQIAIELRREVQDRCGLKISVGVARTKFLAKVASGEAKPDGLLVIEPDREEDFLHPLPVGRLWGVGRVTAGKLESIGIRRVGDLARARESTLIGLLGERAGQRLIDLAHNRDPREVEPRERRRSVGAQAAFPSGSRGPAEVESLAASLTDRVCGRLRSGGRACRTVTLGLRFGDFSRASRSRSLAHPTDTTSDVLGAVRALLRESRAEAEAKGLTLIGISLENLVGAGSVQLSLPLTGETPGADGRDVAAPTHRDPAALDAALDRVRDRFGADSIRRASGIGTEPEVAAPTLPE